MMRMSVLMAQESEESLEGKTEDSVSPPSTASKKVHKPQYPEDTVIRINETAKSKESIDGAVRKRSKKSCAQSPHTPVLASSSFGIRETSLSSNQAEDVEELTETLSLLDDIKSENKTTDGEENGSPFQETTLGGHAPQNPSSLPTPLTHDANNRDDVNGKEIDEGLAPELGGLVPPMTEYIPTSRSHGHVSRSCEGGIGEEVRFNPNERRASKKGKQKSNRSSSRKNRTSSSSGYNPSNYSDSSTPMDDSNSGLVPESQSLPGTPLSHSSAISRSSDASVSSASSTRALLLSHPTQSSTAI